MILAAGGLKILIRFIEPESKIEGCQMLAINAIRSIADNKTININDFLEMLGYLNF